MKKNFVLNSAASLSLLVFLIMAACASSTPRTPAATNATVKPTIKPAARGLTNQDLVKSTVSNIMPQVKGCYVNGLKEKNGIKGKMTTSFQVNAQGKVSRCEIKSSDLQSRLIEDCVCQKISKTTFPAAPKGKMAKIDYPFVFSTKE